jgi:hypothetical protein
LEYNISDKVKTIIEIKRLNEKADTSDLDKKIDQLIYKIYDLTEEEIRIIENA